MVFSPVVSDLFESARRERFTPLAERLRPASLDGFLGQTHLVGPGGPLRKILEAKRALPSMILWGPPGCGKTTLARILARAAGFSFELFSAVTSGLKEARAAIEQARGRAEPTVLFIDEIHRFNRAQQDAFLPCVEDGTIILIGATTENPSFEVNAPLLSRCVVYTLEALTDADIGTLLDRADPKLEAGARTELVRLAGGDARVALNLLELAGRAGTIDAATIQAVAQRRSPRYDAGGEEHYNIVSAFIKSMRGSDPDAALYWMARMLEAGEDPLFVARRMVIFASEDVGNADPQALLVAVAAKEAVDFIGMPEGFIPLAQAATYLATAPKSNASYKGYLAAREDVEKTRNEPVPLHLRNAPTGLMKRLGYGAGYKYSHDYEGAAAKQEYLPPNLRGRVYYKPKTGRAEDGEPRA